MVYSSYSVTDGDADLDVSAADPSVRGVIALKAGTSIVEIRQTSTGNLLASCLVTIKEANVSLDKTSIELYVDESTLITATNYNSSTMTWFSQPYGGGAYCPVDLSSYGEDYTTGKLPGNTKRIIASRAGQAMVGIRKNSDNSILASCIVTVKENVSISIYPTSDTIYVGQMSRPSVNVEPAGTTVTWSSSNTNIVTIVEDSAGYKNMKGVSPGTATVTVSAGDKSATCTVTVLPVAVTGITVGTYENSEYTPTNNVEINTGDTLVLKGSVSPYNATNKSLTWSNTNPEVATIEPSGGNADGTVVLTGKKPGTTDVTVTTRDGGYTATCRITVNAINVTGLNLSSNEINNLKRNQQTQLVATIEPSNATNKEITWQSNNENVAKVDSNGKVTAIKPGNAIIRATSKDNTSIYKECSVTVIPSIESVSLNKSSLEVKLNKSYDLVATLNYDDGTTRTAENNELTWNSSNTSVAEVSNGTITGKQIGGPVTITVTTKDGGYTAQCEVSVIAIPIEGLEISSNRTQEAGKQLQLNAIFTPTDTTNQNVKWESSNLDVATINEQTGLINCISPGVTTITATSQSNDAIKDECTVTVTGTAVESISIQPNIISVKAGNYVDLLATTTPANASNKNVTWESRDVAIATVDENGKVTGQKAGTTIITATSQDGGHKATSIIIVADENSDINTDTTGDGKPNINIDTTGDGKPNLNIDTDGDKKADLNVDTNDDGIADLNIDTDNDGKPNLNIDTDNDGKADLNIDTNSDGKPNVNIDTDGDGQPNLNIDTNGDGKPDVNLDTDSDGNADLNIDIDGDGKADLNVDVDDDGKSDLNIDTTGNGKPDLNIDTDNDGKPNLNVDTDNDGEPNLNIDTNGDGNADLNIDTTGNGNADLNIDTDGDGQPNVNIDTDGDGNADLNIDTTGNGNADLNIDTDDDGQPDVNVDTNSDGNADLNIDTDGDGKPNLNIDTTGNGEPDVNVDTDGDGQPDTNIDPDRLGNLKDPTKPDNPNNSGNQGNQGNNSNGGTSGNAGTSSNGNSKNNANNSLSGKTTSDSLSNSAIPKTGYQIGLLIGIVTSFGLSIAFYKKSKM